MAYVVIDIIDVNDVSGVIVMYCRGLMYRWDDGKIGHCCLVMVDRKYKMDEIQSGHLMVKSLMGRRFVKSKLLSIG
jgi:hypothetical protein